MQVEVIELNAFDIHVEIRQNHTQQPAITGRKLDLKQLYLRYTDVLAALLYFSSLTLSERIKPYRL